MSAEEASPRPWTVEAAPDGGRFFVCRAGDGVSVGMFWREADARLACERVDEARCAVLAAFVRELAQVVEEECGGTRGPFRELLGRARAVAGCGPCHDGREGRE